MKYIIITIVAALAVMAQPVQASQPKEEKPNLPNMVVCTNKGEAYLANGGKSSYKLIRLSDFDYVCKK